MLVKKILNNCVVLVEDENKKEFIVMGNAIGYHYRVNEQIDEEKIDKIFRLTNSKINYNLMSLLEETPQAHFDVAQEIIEYAKQGLGCTLSDSIYVTLIDHLNFAITRSLKNLRTENRLYWDVRKQYPDEFKVGLYALTLLKQRVEIDLWKEEAANIALHIVNAKKDDHEMAQTIALTDHVRDLLLIISRHFGIAFDEDNLNFTRLITHLQFFVERIMNNHCFQEGDDFLYEQIKQKYQAEFTCVLRIQDYTQKYLGATLSHDEMVYLCIHIHRVIDSFMNKAEFES